jgi:hypothetical protein
MDRDVSGLRRGAGGGGLADVYGPPLPITEAGPGGARIKPAVRAAPSPTANVRDEEGARVARCPEVVIAFRGTVGGNPKGLISTRCCPSLLVPEGRKTPNSALSEIARPKNTPA